MQQFTRPDNPLFIPETDGYGAARGDGQPGASNFWPWERVRSGFRPSVSTTLPLAADGKLEVEQPGSGREQPPARPLRRCHREATVRGQDEDCGRGAGLAQIELPFGEWTALVSFPPAFDSAVPNDGGSPSARLKMGRVLIAPIATDEFLVIGIDAQVSFHRTVHPQTVQTQFLHVQEGHYEGSEWKGGRLWNGDEADSGLFFSSPGAVLHVKLGTY